MTPQHGHHGASPELHQGVSETTKQRGEHGACGRDGMVPSHRRLWGAAVVLPGLCHTWHAAAGRRRLQCTPWPLRSSWRKGQHGKLFPLRALGHAGSDQDPLQPRVRRLKPASAPHSASDFELQRLSCSRLLQSHGPARPVTSWRWKRLCRPLAAAQQDGTPRTAWGQAL